MKDKPSEGSAPSDGASQQSSTIDWSDENLVTTFANVVNIQGTREQIEFFLGTNRSWSADKDSAVKVDLTNRIIMTPYAAKRLHMILTGVLREYEGRHGVLKVDDN